MTRKDMAPVGIDDMALYVPKLYLPVRELAYKRNIDPDKLEKGLGLLSMAVPDSDEDSVTMAAEALLELVEKNDLGPGDVDRIYVGTESAVDGSKPIASYLLGILSRYYETQGIDPLRLKQCDATDMTFACIGAVDAVQNSLDFIRLNPDRKAIVIATDWAKYDLGSPGEYTQGAGAVALLLTSNPRILDIDAQWAVSAECVHDFYKPLRRKVKINDIVNENGIDATQLGREVYSEHADTPVYDGHFSNACYTARIAEALKAYTVTGKNAKHPLDLWERLVFHLPYAYQARRMFPSIYMEYLRSTGKWNTFLINSGIEDLQDMDKKEVIRSIGKSKEYLDFVDTKIAPGERASSSVGNIYTGSIFLSLLSTLADEREDLSCKHIGFFAYGSGSKAKVFSGKVVPDYQVRIRDLDLDERLANRQRIRFWEYEYLHRGKLLINLDSISRKVFHVASGWQVTNRFARQYDIRH